jgi:hypothetical protein
MAHDTRVYGEIDSKTDLKNVFKEIRHDVDEARSREGLTELHKRAGYLITLTHAPSWKEKFGDEAEELRKAAEKEFASTARKINRRAKEIGTEPDYDEKWGD